MMESFLVEGDQKFQALRIKSIGAITFGQPVIALIP